MNSKPGKDSVFGVVGVCGVNGNLISRILADHGYEVQANDMVDEKDCRFKNALLDYPQMKIYYGDLPGIFFTQSDYMVLPMALIESESEIYQKTVEYNIPVLTPDDICRMFKPVHPVICITGTNGKTTSVNLLKHIAYKAGLKPCEHNLDNMQGNAADIPALQSRLKGDLNILETGTFGYKGSLEKLASPCEPDVGLITNITPDHLNENSTFLDYASVKGELVKLLMGKTLVVNNDDPTVMGLINKLNYEGNLITFGVDCVVVSESEKECFCGEEVLVREFISGVGRYECRCSSEYGKPDYLACNINSKHDEFDMKTPSGEMIHFKLSLNGIHNIYNTIGAVIIAHNILELDYDLICDAVSSFKGVTGRMQKIGTAGEKQVMIDYAHNPAGIATVLRELKNLYGCVVNVITTSSESGIRGDHEILRNALKYADYVIPASYNAYLCAKNYPDNGFGVEKIVLPEYMPEGSRKGTLGATKEQVLTGFRCALDLDADLIVCTGEAAFKYEDIIAGMMEN